MKNLNECFKAGDRVRNKYRQAGEEYIFVSPAEEGWKHTRMIVEDSSGQEKMFLSTEMEKL